MPAPPAALLGTYKNLHKNRTTKIYLGTYIVFPPKSALETRGQQPHRGTNSAQALYAFSAFPLEDLDDLRLRKLKMYWTLYENIENYSVFSKLTDDNRFSDIFATKMMLFKCTNTKFY